MSKKKNNKRNQTINSISNFNLEIDYDKLAQAIVKAQTQMCEECKNDNVSKEKIGFFKASWLILTNKKDTNGIFTTGLFSLFTSLLFKVIAIIGFVVSPLTIVFVVKLFIESIKAGTNIFEAVLTVIVFVAVSIFVFLFMIIVWGASNEIDKEKDKNYVISVFSGIVSLAALVVAIIALFKEVAV